MIRHLKIAFVVLLLAVGSAACGDDDDTATTVDDETTTTAAAPDEEEAEEPGNLDESGTFVWQTTLSGASEVPGPGDPDGEGTAVITFKLADFEVCSELTVEGIAEPKAAHIHKGGKEVAGPVVVTLPTPKLGAAATSECVVIEESLFADFNSASPDEYYVNVHNADFKDGAVRGQLEEASS